MTAEYYCSIQPAPFQVTGHFQRGGIEGGHWREHDEIRFPFDYIQPVAGIAVEILYLLGVREKFAANET